MARWPIPLSLCALWLSSCGRETPPDLEVHSFAGGCYTLASDDGYLGATKAGFAFSAESAKGAAHLTMVAADLGTYLLYDEDRGYVVADGKRLARQLTLESDVSLIDDDYISGAEWQLETSTKDPDRYQLRSRQRGTWMGEDGLTSEKPLALTLEPATGCTAPPELSVDATGTIGRTTFDDGTLYGIVDTHSHMFSNFGFGGGLFVGAPFHRLGVEHALPDCAAYHGEMGRRDFFGFLYDGGNDGAQLGSVLPDMLAGELSVDNHHTAGFPEFTDWPNARTSSTHQVQYYKWIERAYLAGLRLVVQHATSNAVVCKVSVGFGASPARYDCEDMTATDRQIDGAQALERYIDAQAGGPGEGWFRLVGTPEEAREVIADGKLAVVLGIEVSDLFDCPLTPRPGGPVCDEAHVTKQLDLYHQRGVRVLFPVHKYDNAFTPGDGSNDFIEAGNFLNSGHWSNFTEDCPTEVHGRDEGVITFGGLQQPRDQYQSTPPVEFVHLEEDTIDKLLPYIGKLLSPPVEGNWCQNASLTPIGEFLVTQMMRRGMILEVDHLPQWSYKRTFELLAEHDYPAIGTHGADHDGRIYETGGLSIAQFGHCHDPDAPGASLQAFQDRLATMQAAGLYPGLGFSFDFNGFAGGHAPRFAPGACPTPQEDPVQYPFTSYAGDVQFTQPKAGDRTFDFNTEGMAHVGLLPELIEDLRADAVSDEELEPLFRSAEGYIRMWELAEARGRALSGE